MKVKRKHIINRFIHAKILLLTVHLWIITGTMAQTNEYQFVHFEEVYTEGIYLSFDHFKQQSPVEKTQIIAKESVNDPRFLFKVLSYEQFSFFDTLGQQHIVQSDNIWGIVRKNALYILSNHVLCKVHSNGRWGHFITYRTNIQPGMNIAPGGYYAVQVPLNAGKNTIVNIIDLKNGAIYPMNRKTITNLLEADSSLQIEYNALRRRKQKQLKYLYLRKLNDVIKSQ
ncbi:MAG: hypothetical protein PF489_09495 [Salinivirgaceae bacterium]|jgi:hypothetical protein|nr:hypothetical protein [Salinivirgaceae bacterium]